MFILAYAYVLAYVRNYCATSLEFAQEKYTTKNQFSGKKDDHQTVIFFFCSSNIIIIREHCYVLVVTINRSSILVHVHSIITLYYDGIT